jgi:hypothetical protein
MRALAAFALLALVLAGCTSSPTPGGGAGSCSGSGSGSGSGQAPTFVAQAPWWDVGDGYTVRIERPDAQPQTWRMVNYWNDTETAHFWLGVGDRRQALDMALFDTNPFLGRIHHGILTPHEKGMHAAMYNFPIEDGKRWGGMFFGRNWAFIANEATLQTPLGPDRGFRIQGTSNDGAGHTITYDYSPKLKWFANLEEKDRSGAMVVRATVTDHERGATGTYTFLRGRDFYRGPQDVSGTQEVAFEVKEDVDSLAFYVQARAQGPLEIQLLDPSGAVKKRVAGTGGAANALEEVSPVPMGTWRMRYVATGAVTGQVLAIGLLDTTRTV